MGEMMSCMRFKPKEGRTDDMMKALAEYMRDYPFLESHISIFDLGSGEFALVAIHQSVDVFVGLMDREVPISGVMREFVEIYEDGEAFHSFSGPEVELSTYL